MLGGELDEAVGRLDADRRHLQPDRVVLDRAEELLRDLVDRVAVGQHRHDEVGAVDRLLGRVGDA